MKVNLNWLRDFVDIDVSAQELSQRLTMIGLEVEGLEKVEHSLDNIVAGRILDVRPHPSASRLSLCQVDTGLDRVQIVCGAANARDGVLAPLALPGAVLPDGTAVEKRQIRGETSVGMLLAEDEMGLTDDHSGIMLLPSDISPGSPLTTVLPPTDWVLDVSITPNRPDCACVLGIAREIAAVSGKVKTYNTTRTDSTGGTHQVTADEVNYALVEFENGVTGTLESSGISTGRKNQCTWEIHGSKGSVLFDLENLNYLQVCLDKGEDPVRGFTQVPVTDTSHPLQCMILPPGHNSGWEYGHVHALHHFLECVTQDRPVAPLGATFEDGYRIQVIMDALFRSSATGNRIELTY
jgi:tRNA-binding EMAP/Myf-like protein